MIPRPISDSLETWLQWDEDRLTPRRFITLTDFTRDFQQNSNAKIINSYTLVGNKIAKDYTNALYSNSSEELGFIPRCQCGALTGAAKLNLYCRLCNTVCSTQFVEKLTSDAWIGIPDVFAPFLHPVWYSILKSWTSIGRKDNSVIDIILNPEEEIPDDLIPYIKGRGFQYLYENIDDILKTFLYECPKTAKKNVDWITKFISRYRHLMFTRKIPILHSSLHPEKGNGGTLNYVDSSSKEILQAIVDLSNETFKQHSTTVSFKQTNKMLYEIYMKIIDYDKSLVDEKLGSKQGSIRKHECGSRLFWSLRTVVSPHIYPLPFDEVILPWGTMVVAFKHVILNFLIHRYRKSVLDAMTIYHRAMVQYDPLVDACLQAYIDESPRKAIVLEVGRNPTLAYHSIMQLYCRTYKKDPDDQTIELNACIIEMANIG